MLKGGDDLGEGHVGGDRARNADLVDLQVGVRGDDGAGGEVHALAHQVASDAALLALQPLFDRLKGAARLLHRLRGEKIGHYSLFKRATS